MADSTLSRFIAGMISTGLGNISTLLLGLLAIVVAARHLPAESYGAFVLVQVVAAFLTQISSLGLDLSVSKAITGTEGLEERRRLVNTVIYLRLLVSLVVSAVALGASGALFAMFGSPLLPEFVLYAPLLYLLQATAAIFSSVLQGHFLFNRMAITDFLSSFLNFALLLAFVVCLEGGVTGLLIARASSIFLSAAFAYVSIPVQKRLEFDRSVLRPLLTFGLPLQVNDIFTFIFRRTDTVLIGALLGTANVAYYEIARKIPDSLAQMYEAFRAVYYPFVSRFFAIEQRDRVAHILNHSMRLISFATVLATLITMLFGQPLITALFTERYAPSVPAFVLLMLRLNVSLVGNILGTSIVAAGDTTKPVIINAVTTAVSLLGNLLFIPSVGLVGAALAGLAGSAAANPLNVLFLRRRNVEVALSSYIRPVIAFAVAAMAHIVVGPALPLEEAGVLVLFLALCGLLSVITRQDLSILSKETNALLRGPVRRPVSGGGRT